eukprot:3096790-Rhodomonas_salina.1
MVLPPSPVQHAGRAAPCPELQHRVCLSLGDAPVPVDSMLLRFPKFCCQCCEGSTVVGAARAVTRTR